MTQHEPSAAIEQLRDHQRQLDEHGEFVGVSRQALDEVLDYIAAARVIDAYLPKVDGEPFAWAGGVAWHKPAHRSVMANARLGSWMSAALDDPAVCDAMKADIREWFSAGEPMETLCQALSATHDPLAMARAMQEGRSFQQSVDGWMRQTFPAEVRTDKIERAMRFLEEATELCQSIGLTHEKAAVVLNYVFGRPVGEPSQEVGGSMVTLAALCAAIGENMDECGQREFDRINTPEMRAKIAAKQVSKRLFGMTSERAIDPTKLEAE